MKGSLFMKKYIALLVVIALMITVLVACTGEPSETSGPDDTDVTTATVTTAPSLQIGDDTAGKDYSEIYPAK